MRRLALIAAFAAVAVAGCSPKVTPGGPGGGLVHAQGTTDASMMDAIVEYCGGFGREARLGTPIANRQFSFDCIPR